MLMHVQSFMNDETGAITVDWVVLTAAIIAMTIGIFSTFQDSVRNQRDKASTLINDFRTDVQSYGGQNP
jgi:Flp pilus assembly pilin Flp